MKRDLEGKEKDLSKDTGLPTRPSTSERQLVHKMQARRETKMAAQVYT